MGPGVHINSGKDFLDAHTFSPKTSFQDWRKIVAKWVDLIKADLDADEYMRIKTNFKILGQT